MGCSLGVERWCYEGGKGSQLLLIPNPGDLSYREQVVTTGFCDHGVSALQMGGSGFDSNKYHILAWEGLYNCDDNFLFMGGGDVPLLTIPDPGALSQGIGGHNCIMRSWCLCY